MIFTVVARTLPFVAARPRSTSSSICSRPRCRSHHRLAETRMVSSPASSRAPYASQDVRRHPRVLPSGDPEGVEVLLRHEQGSAPFGRIGPRDEPIPEGVRRALVQRAGRLPGHGVAFDAAVPRVGRVARDPRELERAAVHPRAVHVPVHQEHRTVGDDAVQVLLARGSAGEQVHRPPPSGDPRLAGVVRGVRGDRLQVGVDRPEVVEVHAQQVPSAERGMDVRVLEPGHDQPPGHRPHVGRGVRRDPVAQPASRRRRSARPSPPPRLRGARRSRR